MVAEYWGERCRDLKVITWRGTRGEGDKGEAAAKAMHAEVLIWQVGGSVGVSGGGTTEGIMWFCTVACEMSTVHIPARPGVWVRVLHWVENVYPDPDPASTLPTTLRVYPTRDNAYAPLRRRRRRVCADCIPLWRVFSLGACLGFVEGSENDIRGDVVAFGVTSVTSPASTAQVLRSRAYFSFSAHLPLFQIT